MSSTRSLKIKCFHYEEQLTLLYEIKRAYLFYNNKPPTGCFSIPDLGDRLICYA